MLMNAHQSLKIVVTEALSEPMLTAIPAFAEAASCPDGEAVTAQEGSSALHNLGDGLLEESVSAQLSTKNGFTARCVR